MLNVSNIGNMAVVVIEMKELAIASLHKSLTHVSQYALPPAFTQALSNT